MSITYNGTAIKSMTHDEQEVKTWTHDGVRVWSAKVQLKYVITFTVDTTGTMPYNIKKYSVKDGSLLESYSGHVYKGYDDKLFNSI